MPAGGDPVLAADYTTLAGYTTTRPVGRLTQAATQNLVSGTSMIGITFAASSEDIDTHNYHDTSTNNTRVTPLIAGYYYVTAGLCIAGRTDYTTVEVVVGKNGTGLATASRIAPTTSSQTLCMENSNIVTCNGSTDYFETLCRQANGAAATVATVVSVQFASSLSWFLIRPL